MRVCPECKIKFEESGAGDLLCVSCSSDLRFYTRMVYELREKFDEMIANDTLDDSVRELILFYEVKLAKLSCKNNVRTDGKKEQFCPVCDCDYRGVVGGMCPVCQKEWNALYEEFDSVNQMIGLGQGQYISRKIEIINDLDYYNKPMMRYCENYTNSNKERHDIA